MAVYHQSVRLGDNSLRLTTSNFIFQLNTCGYNFYVTSSLTRGWVCRIQLLLGLVSAVIPRFGPNGTRDHILLFRFDALDGQVSAFISPRNRVARFSDYLIQFVSFTEEVTFSAKFSRCNRYV
jgi:hypothetical protein